MITEEDLTATEEMSAQELATPIAPARCSVPGSWCSQKTIWMERNIKYLSKNFKELNEKFWVFFCPRQFAQFLQLLKEAFAVGPSAKATAKFDLSSTNPLMLP